MYTNKTPGELVGFTGCQENLDIPDDMAAGYGEADEAMQMLVSSLTNGYGGAGAFIQSIVDGNHGEPSFEDGYQAQQVIDAAILSNDTGMLVTL